MTLWYWNGTRHRLTTLHLQHLLLAGAALLVTRRIWSWAVQKRGECSASQAGVHSRFLPAFPQFPKGNLWTNMFDSFSSIVNRSRHVIYVKGLLRQPRTMAPALRGPLLTADASCCRNKSGSEVRGDGGGGSCPEGLVEGASDQLPAYGAAAVLTYTCTAGSDPMPLLVFSGSKLEYMGRLRVQVNLVLRPVKGKRRAAMLWLGSACLIPTVSSVSSIAQLTDMSAQVPR